MYDSEWLHHYDIWQDGTPPKDVTVVIEKVAAGELMSVDTRKKSKKPVVYFRGKEKALALNKTNGKSIAGIYGPDTAKWVGKSIILFKAQADAFGQVVPCIRIRPNAPVAGKQPVQLTPEEIAEGRSAEAEAGGE
jgi:hypothetical protein